MRIVYVEIDSLRADHLGCHGYPRATTPNLDRSARESIRFLDCYASKVPCLPSRSAMFSGRFGTCTGVGGHGGTAAEPVIEGSARGVSSTLGRTAWALMQKLGLRTASISSCIARHSAHHFCAGPDEDPHTPYRKLLSRLGQFGILDRTALLVSSDHGEMLGELNVYGDHHAADEQTAHVPCLLRWPGLAPRAAAGLCYQFDVAATIVDLLGGRVPQAWDGRSMASNLRAGRTAGRDALVVTQGAWSCQRGVRWSDYIALHTRHDGYHVFEPRMLFDLGRDPHEQVDLALMRPDLVRAAERHLTSFTADVIGRSASGIDPLTTVLAEGGPFHPRRKLARYVDRLHATGRADFAEPLRRLHAAELTS